jgi:hypothetical protein
VVVALRAGQGAVAAEPTPAAAVDEADELRRTLEAKTAPKGKG